jgi:glycosyltransferase involved in cell wall biosynthesis
VKENGLRKAGITGFCPCYNDGGTIASMAVLMDRTLQALTDNYEIIVIDDGSTDQSRNILRALEKMIPRLRVVYHEFNRGYGGALRSGFASATKDWVFYTDGDFQYDVTELAKLASCVTDQVDVVQGFKVKRHDPLHRIVIGKCYQYLMKVLFGLKIRDVDCDFRLIRRRVFERVRLEYDSGVICLEMVKKMHLAGCRFVEVPVSHYFRAYGKSQFFNFPRVFRVGRDILRLWWQLVVKSGRI